MSMTAQAFQDHVDALMQKTQKLQATLDDEAKSQARLIQSINQPAPQVTSTEPSPAQTNEQTANDNAQKIADSLNLNDLVRGRNMSNTNTASSNTNTAPSNADVNTQSSEAPTEAVSATPKHASQTPDTKSDAAKIVDDLGDIDNILKNAEQLNM